MKNILTKIKHSLSLLVNTRAAGLYFLLFAGSIAVATFIENDFGTSAAQKVVYKAWWFELLLLLFSLTILNNIFKFRMIEQKKWAILSFHLAIIIILIGAGVTRYFSFEGIMHIRENNTSNSFFSSDNYLKFKVTKNNTTYDFDEPVLFASLGNNNWQESYLIDADLIEVQVKEFIANPQEIMKPIANGKPIIKMVVAGMNGREEHFVSSGETKRIGQVVYNFKNVVIPEAINIVYDNGTLLFNTDKTLTQMVMATQKKDTIYPSNDYKPLMMRSLYSDGVNNFVIAEFSQNAEIILKSKDSKLTNASLSGLLIDVTVNGTTQETFITGNKGYPGTPATLFFDDLSLSISYGVKTMTLPFSIKLKEFIFDKYPGTNSASSYASEVELIDQSNNVRQDFRIYMNNILDYDGYRFFQSSFDKDEKGTYLSVNHDLWGTLISYIGYTILTLGMFLTFFSKKSRFYQLTQKIRKLRKQSATFVLLMLLSFAATLVNAQSDNYAAVKHAVPISHANDFSLLVVQDFKGRMKPVHTLSREVLRKLSRQESMFGLTADQILLSMYANSQEWVEVEIIKLGKHQDVQELLGINNEYASYDDFFLPDGAYKLRDEMRRIYSLEPIDRGIFEKELLKIDERVNILNMAYSGSLLKIVPNPGDPNNTWLATNGHNHEANQNHSVAERFFSAYHAALEEAMITKDYDHANHLLEELKTYQIEYGGEIMPSNLKIQAEILLNQANIFTRLAVAYILIGLALLFFLFLSVFKPNINLNKVYTLLFALVLTGFVLHTLGLGMRWYVSGRAPWSNGYESMIYIAWTSTLAGLLFTRKSFGGLAATMVLAATILFVSTLSFLDPEITPLVPVLKSYWLTIHVSMEAGSYGFLMLGAIIGLINLILMIFINNSNKRKVQGIIQEMSYLSELTLIGGLFMVSIGTYLGGVWANESWGRYWGWDAKETWALVTILVYAFILHMRLIPKLAGLFSYNLATLFGLGTVLMTYYGVNYYLSGLHSYATGDPVPVPNWVYICVGAIIIISTLAFINKRRYKIVP